MNGRFGALLLTVSALAAYFLWFDGGAVRLFELTGSTLITPSAVNAPTQTTPEQEPRAAETLALNPLSILTLESTAALVERPVFNPSRRPRPPTLVPVVVEESNPIPVEVPDESPNRSDYTLLAIAAGPSLRVAAVRLNGNGEVVYLKKGEAVSKWEVLDIGYRDITIGNKNKSIKLQLFERSAVVEESVAANASDGAPSVDTE